MRLSARFMVAVALLAALGAFVLASRWYGSVLPALTRSTAQLQLSVTSSADRGPGSLREALFAADAAPGSATIVVRVTRIVAETPLPPLASPHGLSIVAAPPGAQIDGSALGDVPVIDVDAEHVSITGLGIRHCSGAAILVRASHFHLDSGSIEFCDTGVDVAENVQGVNLERNRFAQNRLSVRFAATSRNTLVVGNQFSADTDAGIWAVRGTPESREASIAVRNNRFSGERIGMVVGNVAMQLEHNVFSNVREAAIHLLGSGAVVRGNRISGAAAMGIVAEDSSAALIVDNEIDHVSALGIMIRGSNNTLVQSNRLHNCGYGIAFVLGSAHYPSTAIDNIIVASKYDAIDVVGDSPILRHNRVLQAGSAPLHVVDYRPPAGPVLAAHPFLDGNDWGTASPAVAAVNAPRPMDGVRK